MKAILDILLQKYKSIFPIVLLGALSFGTAILHSTFNFNPYLIGLIFFALKVGNIYSVIITVVAMISGAFIRSVSYGLTLSIVSSLLLLFLALPKLKKAPYKLLLPLFLLYVTVSPFYLATNFNFSAIRLVLSSLAISLIFVLYVESKKAHFILQGSVILLLPGIVTAVPVLFTVAVFLTLFYIQTIDKIEMRFSLILISLIINYTYFLLPLEQILYLLIPCFVASLIPRQRLRIAAALSLALVLHITKYPTSFYRTTDFYLPIIALLLYLLWPAEKAIYQPEKDETSQLIDRIRNIEEYISFIEESTPIPTLDKQNIEENLKIKPCSVCLKKENCQNISRLSNNLPASLFPELKKEILHYCPNGSKLVYRYKVVRDMVDQEIKTTMVEKEKFNALKGIIQPLKTLCEPELKTIDAEALNISLAAELIKEYTDEEIVAIQVLSLEEVATIEDKTQKKLSSHYRFNFIDHTYTYQFLQDLKNHFSIDLATKGFTKTNGDTTTVLQKPGYFEFALLDAMGHFESASKYSFFAKRLLELGRIHNRAAEERIKELNNILFYQNTNENYVTLDMLCKNGQTKNYQLYKCGSAPTFFWHNSAISVLENKSLPLGIVPLANNDQQELSLVAGDVLVFITDGFEKTVPEDIKTIITENISAQTYLEQYQEKYGLTDDASIAILRYS